MKKGVRFDIRFELVECSNRRLTLKPTISFVGDFDFRHAALLYRVISNDLSEYVADIFDKYMVIPNSEQSKSPDSSGEK